MSNIEKSFVDAISIMVNDTISKSKNTLTVEAEIISVEDAGLKRYTVEYMNNRFSASANNSFAHYQPGNKVYVLVPEGDFSKEKIILGLTNPEQSIVAATSDKVLYHMTKSDNLFLDVDYFAHLCSYKEEIDREISLSFSTAQFAQYYEKYKTFLFSFKVKTKLPKEQQARGNYGLKLRVYVDEADAATGTNIVRPRDFVFDINNLIGNPYSFSNYATQNFYVTIENCNTNKKPELYCFVKDFIQDESKTEPDIFIENIKFQAVDILTEQQKQGYHLSIAATKGNCFFTTETADKILTPVLLLNGEQTEHKYFPCYWFVEDNSITEISEEYSSRGGRGWRCLNEKTVETNINGNIVYQYKTDMRELTVSKGNIITSKKYKCVLVNEANNLLISATIDIIDLDADTIIELKTATGDNTFIKGVGDISLLCSTNYKEALVDSTQGKVSYYWTLFDANDNVIGENDFYTIVNGETRHKDNNGNTTSIETEISFPASLAGEVCSVGCSIYFRDTILIGTKTISLTSMAQPGYRVNILNGGKVFKYDAEGDSPVTEQYDGADRILELAPLSFKVVRPDNSELTESEYAFCKYCWKISKNSMIVPSSAEYTADDKYYYIKGQGREIYPYKIENRFDVTKTENSVELEIEFDDQVLKEVSEFSFVKDGLSGTNGTKYFAKIAVVNPIASVNDYVDSTGVPRILLEVIESKNNKGEIITTIDPYGYRTSILGWDSGFSIDFEVHLYKNGEATEIKEDAVEWTMFDAKYTNPCFGFSVNVDDDVKILDRDTSIWTTLVYKPDFSFENNETCNILQAKIKVADAETPGQDYYIYAYFAIPVTIVKATIDNPFPDKGKVGIIPKVSGYNEVVYSSDGTNPQYASLPYFYWSNDYLTEKGLPFSEDDITYNISWSASPTNLTIESLDREVIELEHQEGIFRTRILPKDKYDNGETCNYVKAIAKIANNHSDIQAEIDRIDAEIAAISNDKNAETLDISRLEKFVEVFPSINFIKDAIKDSGSFIGSRAECLQLLTSLESRVSGISRSDIIKDSETNRMLSLIEEEVEDAYKIIKSKWDRLGEAYLDDPIILTDEAKKDIEDYFANAKPNNDYVREYLNAAGFIQEINLFNLELNNYKIIYNYCKDQNYEPYSELLDILQDVSKTKIYNDFSYNDDDKWLEAFNTFYNQRYKTIIKDCIKILTEYKEQDGDINYSYNNVLSKITLLEQKLKEFYIIDENGYTLRDNIREYIEKDIIAKENEIDEKNKIKNSMIAFIKDNTYLNHELHTFYPIVMLYNRYEMSAINGWDGNKIYTGENDDYLYAPQVGAGIKEDDNSFTGIIIGNKYSSKEKAREVGLFGYSHGKESIFLNARDGSAAFGFEGSGRIEIIPGKGGKNQKAIIQGGNYKEGSSNEPGTGMQIDLTSPEIKWGNGNFSVDSEGILTAVDGIFTGKIEAKEGYIGDKDKGFTITNEAIYNKTESLTSDKTGVYLGTDGIRLYQDKDANVTIANGVLTANGGVFKGEITANKGTIGGWQIDETKLFSVTSAQQKNKITLDPTEGISQIGDIYDREGKLIETSQLCWNLSNDGNVTFRGNMYLANVGQMSKGITKGKFVARGYKTHNDDGILANAHEVVIRGLDPGEDRSGAIMIRKAKTDIKKSTYDTDNGHTYPFIVTGTGILKVGVVDSTKTGDDLHSSDNYKFVVDPTATGDNPTVTVRGNLKITGTTTLGKVGVTTNINNATIKTATCENLEVTSGSLTLGDNFQVTNDGTLTAKKGTIGAWTIVNEPGQSSTGRLEGYSTKGTRMINICPEGIKYNGHVFYLLIYKTDKTGSANYDYALGGITKNGWVQLQNE